MTDLEIQIIPSGQYLLEYFAKEHEKEDKMTDNLTPTAYRRKTFSVEAVQVAEDNMDAIANWCQGQVLANRGEGGEGGARFFVKVPVKRPLNDRQSRAYVGDWVLKARSGFKVYTQRAFEGCFELESNEVPDGLGGKVSLGGDQIEGG